MFKRIVLVVGLVLTVVLTVGTSAAFAGKKPPPPPPKPTLEQRVAALEAQVAALTQTVNDLSTQLGAMQQTDVGLRSDMDSLGTQLAAMQQTDVGLRSDVGDILANPVLDLGPYVSVVPGALYDTRGKQNIGGPSVVFTGANLFTKWGTGARDQASAGFGVPAALPPFVSTFAYGSAPHMAVVRLEPALDCPWLVGWKIYRSASELGPWTEVGSLRASMSWGEWYDENVPGGRYYYAARSYDDLGNMSVLSNISSIDMP